MSDVKSVLITGGNSGIGFATARLFKNNRYQVTISGRDRTKLEAAAKELDCEFIVADVADVEALQQLAEAFSEGLDVLVNNAGMAAFMPMEMHSVELFDQFYYTNVRGPMLLCQYLMPALGQRSGSITNVSSIIVEHGKANATLYAATKGSMDAMTRSLAIELAPKGIRVNVVSPGAIDTPIVYKLGVPEEMIAPMLEQQAAAIPLKRLGNPQEVAEVIYAQSQASYVTGAVWKVDGGVSAE